MTNKEATKALGLLNELVEQVKAQNQIDLTDAVKQLRMHLQKTALTESGNKTAAKLLPIIADYLKRAGKRRSDMASVQHAADGRQFIIDGFTAFVFNEHHPELDAFPKKPHEESFKIEQVLGVIDPYESDDEEDDKMTLAVWESLDRYKIYLKSINAESEYNEVYMFGRIFDSNHIATATKICGDLSKLYLYGNKTNAPLRLTGESVEALILPVRAKTLEEFDAIKNRTMDFLKTIEN